MGQPLKLQGTPVKWHGLSLKAIGVAVVVLAIGAVALVYYTRLNVKTDASSSPSTAIDPSTFAAFVHGESNGAGRHITPTDKPGMAERATMAKLIEDQSKLMERLAAQNQAMAEQAKQRQEQEKQRQEHEKSAQKSASQHKDAKGAGKGESNAREKPQVVYVPAVSWSRHDPAKATSETGEPLHTLIPYTTISCANMSAVNSDFPGPIKAIVTSIVRDSKTMDHDLIPQYSVLGLEQGKKTLIFGQEGFEVNGVSVSFPDTRTIVLPGVGTDQMGQIGWRGEVDRHLSTIFMGVLVKGALKGSVPALTQITAVSGGTGGAAALPGAIAGGIAQDGGRSGEQMADPFIRTAPTVKIKGAQPCTIILTKELKLPRYVHGGAYAGR